MKYLFAAMLLIPLFILFVMYLFLYITAYCFKSAETLIQLVIEELSIVFSEVLDD